MLDAMQARGLRQQVNRVRSALSTVFAFAIERDYTEVNPVVNAGLKMHRLAGVKMHQAR
jgi:hypothetical protein